MTKILALLILGPLGLVELVLRPLLLLALIVGTFLTALYLVEDFDFQEYMTPFSWELLAGICEVKL